MASGGNNVHITAKRGAASLLTVPLPFKPGMGKLFVNNGGDLEMGVKTYLMPTDEYLSTTTGLDAGVTIVDQSITIASGADVNVVGQDIHIEAHDNYQE